MTLSLQHETFHLHISTYLLSDIVVEPFDPQSISAARYVLASAFALDQYYHLPQPTSILQRFDINMTYRPPSTALHDNEFIAMKLQH